MRKILLLPLLLMALQVSAGPIGVERAKELATQFFNKNATRSTAAKVELEWAGSSVDGDATRATAVNADEALIYVFNRTDDKGFVVLSGEDTKAYVIAFSYDNFFDMSNLPESTRYIMSTFCADLAQARANAPEATRAESLEYDLGVGNVVLDHKTAKWNQGEPYNRYCPTWPGQNRSLTGCVATGMAIVMYHYKWPDCGVGTVGGYYVNNDSNKFVPNLTLGDPYKWDKMLPGYRGVAYNDESAFAVARLMYDCGVCLGMSFNDYGSGSSTSRIPGELLRHFKYSPSAEYYNAGKNVNGVWTTSDFTREEWLEAVERNLREFGPMNVGIKGHSIVYDGYTDKHFIGLNHGWGGSSDGFWNLVPQKTDDWYYPNTYAVFYLQPLKDGVSGAFFNIQSSSGKNGFFASKVTRFKQNEPFEFTLSLFQNLGNTFNGDIAIVMCDRDGNVIEKLGGQDNTAVASRTAYVFSEKSLTITAPIKPGYRLRVYTKELGSDTWKWARHVKLSINDEIIVCASPEEIAAQTSFQYNPSNKTIVMRNRLAMEYEVRNDKDEVVMSGAKAGAGTTEFKNGVSLGTALTLDLSQLAAGDYTVSLTCGSAPYTFVLTL